MALEDILLAHKEGHLQAYLTDKVYNGSTVTAVSIPENFKSLEKSTNMLRPVSGACHSNVRTATADYVVTSASPSAATKPGVVKFYDWLLNRSAFRDVFLVKDPVLSLTNGFVKTTDYCASAWLGAAQLCRLTTSEYKATLALVGQALEDGYKAHPLLLLFLFVKYNVTRKLNSSKGEYFYSSVLAPDLLLYYNGLSCSHLPSAPTLQTFEHCRAQFSDTLLPKEGAYNLRRNKNWPLSSNTVLLKERGQAKAPSDSAPLASCASLFSTFPTYFGSPSLPAKQLEGSEFLWKAAVSRLLVSVENNSLTANLIDLKKVEDFSLYLGLGA